MLDLEAEKYAMHMGNVKNNENKMWQDGDQMWKN